MICPDTKGFRPVMLAALVLVLGSWAGILSGCRKNDYPHHTKQIYFGDLHVHTTVSLDAFGIQTYRGLDNGPEQACDFARICAQVDFYSMNDHAEFTSGNEWDRVVKSVKDCNARYRGDGWIPEMVAFQGFEWTSSMTNEAWGHKNVVFRNDQIPSQPVASFAPIEKMNNPGLISQLPEIFKGSKGDVDAFITDAVLSYLVPRCVGEVNKKCLDVADTPQELWLKLNAFYGMPEFVSGGYDALVIPHGTAWGLGTLHARWDTQINPTQHDPNLQRLVEVYSGHGNSEEYRSVPFSDCTTTARTIAFAHCGGDAGCQSAVTDFAASYPTATSADYVASFTLTTTSEEWGLCNQCTDCYQAAFNYITPSSVQAGMAMSGFDKDGNIQTRFKFGFLASTDEHTGQGARVKEDKKFTDIVPSAIIQLGQIINPTAQVVISEWERVNSYLYPGGLVAVHAAGRTRDAIFDALKRREVYGTSGPRIQLWFNLLAAGNGTLPMGSEVGSTEPPTFEVTAIGDFQDLPGCPQDIVDRFGQETVDSLCLGDCYNPGAARIGISRVEVVKITPQKQPGEGLAPLIKDPFLIITNTTMTEDGKHSPIFTATFTDTTFSAEGRDALYYVRAIQDPTPAVNGTPMTDMSGRTDACTEADQADTCMSMTEERAWSSPIFINYGGN